MTVGIFGVTGLIGRTFLDILLEEEFDCNLFFFASEKSAGKIVYYNEKMYIIKSIKEALNYKMDYALLFTPKNVSNEIVELLKESKTIIIDNSSYYRMAEDVPLVIPEINIDSIKNKKLIANPNCVTIISLLPLYYIDRMFSIESINYTSYQSLSGGGLKYIEEYVSNAKNRKPIFESVLPKIGNIQKNNYTEEEEKMIYETQKILNKKINISATCTRIPALFTHSISVDVKLKKTFTIKKIEECLKQARITINNDFNNVFQYQKNNVCVSRIRQDLYDKKMLHFFVTGDNLRVGAAYNAFAILKHLLLN